jgi:hypothetical protein
MAMQVERGTFGSVPLGGVSFIVLGYTPEEMGKGNWSVGLVVDERATAEQRDAIAAIASGAAGGPMAPLSGLIGRFLGGGGRAIKFERSGNQGSVKAGALVDLNLAVILALTAFVAFEKVGPFGAQSARVSGALLIAAGAWMLLG